MPPNKHPINVPNAREAQQFVCILPLLFILLLYSTSILSAHTSAIHMWRDISVNTTTMEYLDLMASFMNTYRNADT